MVQHVRLESTNVEPKEAKHVDRDLDPSDHRYIGKAQSLFMTHPYSPGSVFMLPHGTRIVHKLQEFLRSEYIKFGYQEVITPLIYKKGLWETSGHWQNYMDDMYMVQGGQKENDEEGLFGLKPMNCPGHCLIFDSTPKSYRDLPIRLADFSPLHRNEASGALSGLTRVRRFHQDDAHIFCTEDQILPEISSCLSFVERVYTAFQFPQYDFTLSTRPKDGYIGSLQEWENAEGALRKALDVTGKPWTIKEGDGAFYGPKIDIMIRDSAGRSHQTATIQLDFQLPRRFNLRYSDENDQIQTPVIVHRAILGSIERMMAILIEHTGGKWPFWLSPRQGVVIPVATQFMDYAQEAAQILARGEASSAPQYYVDADTSPRDRLNKMIRRAQLNQYNYIFVVGQKELDERKVNVRTRKGDVLGTMRFDQVRAMFAETTEQKL